MIESAPPSAASATQPLPILPDDPVLADLQQAANDYSAARLRWEKDRAELDRLRTENRRLQDSVATHETQIVLARERAQQQQNRAAQLAESLMEIHRALFDGNLYALILKACLSLTGATRGLYVTARGEEDILRIRAAVDVDGYPQAPPSAFIQGLCRKVLDDQQSVAANSPAEMRGLPQPERESERFHNVMIAPVVLFKNFDGIIIAADKPRGGFTAEDLDALLSVGDQAAVAVENVHLHRELQSAYLATVMMLADTMEAKDPYTHGHCELVSRLARLTADQMNLSATERSIICYAALLHDIGKIAVSDGILNKPGPLLPEERALMQAHVRVGHDLLSKVPALEIVGDAVLHHHECYDGHGYPDGLRQEAIPVASRVVGVVDAYCAMITKRSYKDAYSDAYARAELQRCAGSQFDPQVVVAFLAVLDSPESSRPDPDDEDAECGVLPGFGHIREAQRAIYH